MSIAACNLVPGDLLLLAAGDAVEPQTLLEQRIAQFGSCLAVALDLYRQLPLAEVSMASEDLPVTMAIALGLGMQRMAARGTIIRRLSAVETLGSTTMTCTDKPGTLTRNEITVSGIDYTPQGHLSVDDAALTPLLWAVVLYGDAQLLAAEATSKEWTMLGDPTEGALLVLAVKAGLDLAQLAFDAPREAELPLGADNKMMAIAGFAGWLPAAVGGSANFVN